jgi:hypothetical protein
LLATYQEVARGVVNLVRIQSQRLDMANPYSMRGTLTRTGRPVLVEQVPPARLCGQRVAEMDKQVQKLAKKREFAALVPVPLLSEGEGLVCMAEEVADGVALADILRERGSLGVAESYVVLAGVDAALSQVEKGGVKTSKLRLEDIFLLTGFGREDPRTTRLLSTKINEWPSFTVMLRAHPTLGAMSGRGTNPACLLPPAVQRKAVWQAGWLASLAKFLLGLENGLKETTARDFESVARLLDDELANARDGRQGSRSDLLARFARVIQHYDLVAPEPITTEEPKAKPAPRKRTDKADAPPAEPVIAAKPMTRPLTVPMAPSAPASPIAAALPSLPGAGAVLTAGGLSEPEPAESVGFAELLFRGPTVAGAPVGGSWGKGASEDFAAGQVGGWPGDMPDTSPWWLKASVFIGGSMVAGALLAQLSGHALWQKMLVPKSPPAATAKGKHS